MKKIEIALQKRSGKFKLYIAVAIFVAWMLILSVAALISHGFDWSAAVFTGLMVFAAIGVGKALYDYYTQKDAKLVVSSDGQTMQFYINHSTGNSNESDSIKLADMKRFYVVEKKTRYFLKDKSFEFEPKSGIFKENIDVFPSLSDIDENGVKTVMQFVGETAPGITLGYYGSLYEKMFNR